MSFKATFRAQPRFEATFRPQESIKATFRDYIVVPVAEWFDGDYSITPTTQEQTIPISGKTGRRDIVVGAIPQNYGLVTWDGSVLTVS